MEIKIEQLIALYEKKLREQPNNPVFYKKLIDLYYNQGNFDAAFETYQKAIDLQANLEAGSQTVEKVVLPHSKNKTENGDLYNWINLTHESVTNYPNGLESLRTGKIDGILIKEVFSKPEMARVKNRIESSKYAKNSIEFGNCLGASLIVTLSSTRNIDQYFREASIGRVQLNEIFENRFEQRLCSTLEKLSGGRSVEVLKQSAENLGTPANLRMVCTGKKMKAHTENVSFEKAKVYEHMKQIDKQVDILSYFFVIQKPEKGGRLVLYDLLWKQTPAAIKNDFNFGSNSTECFLEKVSKQYINPDVGDMVIFNGGQIWHKVSEVDGEKERITVGGFLAHSKDDRTIFYFN